MKKILNVFVICLLLQSFQCEKPIVEKSRNDYSNELRNNKQVILDYIASFPCDETTGCNFIAFGSKPCGGPWEYLIYSNAVDEAYLTEMVNTYNQLENSYNSEFEIFSDCAIVNPPEQVGCINGICTIIN
ncbi:hypothetical protein [Flavobacterium sp. NRK F7]|uniref:hypothetical protein n=1 Tax=Flavobacterium sp. NRK F7 TaxID=2954930 RepID=UPI002090864C|nr:hypothetical protein [Flavobacterium sp. NRK F7]MCO6162141.1 hypothetical protein [Flavobacterium sp. NRK F7]